jgi:hypothetical protein
LKKGLGKVKKMKKVDKKHSQILWEDKVEEDFASKVRSFLQRFKRLNEYFCNFGSGNQLMVRTMKSKDVIKM